MDLGIRGARAFIGGASAGIGYAIADALAAEGCNLMLCARNAARLEQSADALRTRHGVRVEHVAADLDRAPEVNRVVGGMLGRFGGADILVSNSGGPPPGGFDESGEAEWSAGFERTLMSAVRLARGFLPGMRTAGFGRIIHVTSISVRQPVPRLILSNAFRAAVTGMAKTLSDEVAAAGITVNCIAPGYIATDRLRELFEDRAVQAGESYDEAARRLTAAIPAGRLGEPAEIGALAAFLASPRAAYITGATIGVDGGLYRGVF